MYFRRRGSLGVELLERRLQNLGLRRPGSLVVRGPTSDLRPPDRQPPRDASSIALDHLAAAHLEHLDDGAGRADLDAERVAIAEPRAGHLLLPLLQRLDRPQRVAQLRRLLEPLRRPPPSVIRVRSCATSSSLRPSRNSRVCCTATSYCSSLQISRTHGAMQRWMSYSRHGRARSPVMTSLHDRMPNSRCVSAIVRRPSFAGMNGPGVDSGRPSRRCGR